MPGDKSDIVSKPGTVNIKVLDASGNECYIAVKKPTELGRVRKAYAERMGKPDNSVRFTYDGTRLSDTDTPEIVSTCVSEAGLGPTGECGCISQAAVCAGSRSEVETHKQIAVQATGTRVLIGDNEGTWFQTPAPSPLSSLRGLEEEATCAPTVPTCCCVSGWR